MVNETSESFDTLMRYFGFVRDGDAISKENLESEESKLNVRKQMGEILDYELIPLSEPCLGEASCERYDVYVLPIPEILG
ncbi:hypothetical protein CMI46_00495 [Candidatus Pacearchaeota archaeon]|nr:hypothetical protein [Candidatus Pacearchaeota archaeon]|tara:strand:+ start:7241 stop:7480 length:240 start_codon:yes stop_codon:yes gene_type:complete